MAALTRSRTRRSSSTRSWAVGQAEAVVCDYATLLGAFGGQFLDPERAAGVPDKGGGLTALAFMKMLSTRAWPTRPRPPRSRRTCSRRSPPGKIAVGLNWTFQLAASKDPKQSQVTQGRRDDPAHAARHRRQAGARRQRRPAGDDHHRHQAPQRGLAVRQVHHQPGGAERLRRRLAADLGLVLQRPRRRQDRRPAAGRGRQDAAAEHDPAPAGARLQRRFAGARRSQIQKALLGKKTPRPRRRALSSSGRQ